MAALSIEIDSAVIRRKSLLQCRMTAQSSGRTVRGSVSTGAPPAHESGAATMPRTVMIAAGGTADRSPGTVCIQLVESPTSASSVSARARSRRSAVRSQIGISEARSIGETQAAFKQGIRFVDRVRPTGSPGRDHCSHPFSLPSSRVDAPSASTPSGTCPHMATRARFSAGRMPRRRFGPAALDRRQRQRHVDIAACARENSRRCGDASVRARREPVAEKNEQRARRTLRHSRQQRRAAELAGDCRAAERRAQIPERAVHVEDDAE